MDGIGEHWRLDWRFHCYGADNAMRWSLLSMVPSLDTRGAADLFDLICLSMVFLRDRFLVVGARGWKYQRRLGVEKS